MNSQAKLILDGRNGTGESPYWNADEQKLFWVDISQRKLWSWDATTGQSQNWGTTEMPACIAWAGNPGLWVAAMQTGIFKLRLQPDGAVKYNRLAEVVHARPDMRFNDGRCDRQGRFWAGTMMMDMKNAQPVGAIYRYENESGLKKVLDGFMTPNGMAFSPDGKTMYLSDSHPMVQKIWAFDFDTDTGTPSHQRLFVDMAPMPGRPDGAAVDAEGDYWICANDAGLVHRFSPQGDLVRSYAVPVKKPAMCAFGGANLDVLFVTSIRPEGMNLSDQPLAGGLFSISPGAKGLAETPCII